MSRKPYGGHPPFVAGSDTSEAAAASMDEAAPGMRARILWHIAACAEHGATCWEVERDLGMSHQTASARIKELKDLGLLAITEEKRLTGSRRKAHVLVANRVAAPVDPDRPLAPRELVPILEARIRTLESEKASLQAQLTMALLREKRSNPSPRQMPLWKKK